MNHEINSYINCKTLYFFKFLLKLSFSATCPGKKAACPEGKGCFDLWQQCDGKPNCPDGSDEAPELCEGLCFTSW